MVNAHRHHGPMQSSLHYYPVGNAGTGISAGGVARNYENHGDFLSAGLVYAKAGDKNNALRCMGKCEEKGDNLGVARIYFELGMPREAIAHARKCTGPDTFKAAELLLDKMEPLVAKECADTYVKYVEGQGADNDPEGTNNTAIRKRIPPGESMILLRIYCKTGDAEKANLFTVPDRYTANRDKKKGKKWINLQ